MKGAYKGVEITAPADGCVRPTVDHLKKNIFEMTGEPTPAVVWDLFAGCGGVGLEYLSRGAAEVVFVESLNKALSCLNLNVAECRLRSPQNFSAQNVRVVQAPVENFLKNPAGFGVSSSPGLIFLDPPYGQGWMAKVVPLIVSCGLVASGTKILAEHVLDDPMPESGDFKIVSQKSYGPKVLTLFQRAAAVFER